tara:strand:- start:463 stop:1053 length:591 start_codon:yes stop_codon:yes gene_type:complete
VANLDVIVKSQNNVNVSKLFLLGLYMKKYIFLIIIIICILFIYCSLPTTEGFLGGGRRGHGGDRRGNGRGRRGHGGRGGARGRKGDMGRLINFRRGNNGHRERKDVRLNRRFPNGGSGRGGWSGGYLNRFRRRNDGYSGNNSYPYWNNFFSAPSWYDYWWSPPCECKRGCTPDGCAYPGNGINDCIWSTDCNCCNF